MNVCQPQMTSRRERAGGVGGRTHDNKSVHADGLKLKDGRSKHYNHCLHLSLAS